MIGAEFLIEIVDTGDGSQASPHKPFRISMWLILI